MEHKVKVCKICGEQFTTKNSNKEVLCSDWCKKEYKRQKDLEYQYRIGHRRLHKDEEWQKTKKQAADIFDRIEQLTKELGCTFDQLAQGCQICPNSMYNFVRGKTCLSIESISKIAMHTDKTIDWILGLEEL